MQPYQAFDQAKGSAIPSPVGGNDLVQLTLVALVERFRTVDPFRSGGLSNAAADPEIAVGSWHIGGEEIPVLVGSNQVNVSPCRFVQGAQLVIHQKRTNCRFDSACRAGGLFVCFKQLGIGRQDP